MLTVPSTSRGRPVTVSSRPPGHHRIGKSGGLRAAERTDSLVESLLWALEAPSCASVCLKVAAVACRPAYHH